MNASANASMSEYDIAVERIKAYIAARPDDVGAYEDLADVFRSAEKVSVRDRVWLAEGCQGGAIRAVQNRDVVLAGKFDKLSKRALLLAAPDHFDSYIQYIEWERDPRKRFYLPRRRVLKQVVDQLQRLDELDLLGISLPPGAGKLLADDTPIMTRDGWKTHGELKVGDYVVGMDGQYKRVERVYPKDVANYEVEFTNGDVIKCHGNHEWLVSDRNRGIGKYLIMTTEEMYNGVIERGTPGKRGHRFMYGLPHVEPMVGEERELPVPPYVFGAWLGDGTTSKPCLTISDADNTILMPVCKYYPLRHVYKQVGCKVYDFGYDLTEDLRKVGLCNSYRGPKVRQKFIPDIYLTASYRQRMELLCGLLDTDGTLSRHNRYSYTTVNTELLDGICKLISTFGWRHYVTRVEPCLSSSGIRGKSPVYTVGFTPDRDIPVRVPRKRMKSIGQRRCISIRAIRKIDPVPGNCIQVEGGMYLAGKTMLPTHNSTTAIFYLTWLAGRNPDDPILAGSHSNAFIRGMYDECLRVVSPEGEYLWKDVFPGVTVVNTNAKDCRIDLGKPKRFETLEFTTIGSGNAGLYRAIQLLYCDDLVSGIEVALSKERLDKLWEVYTTDLRQRKQGDHCKELHIATRWSVHDVIGRLEMQYENNPRANFIVIPALNDEDESNFDYLYGVGFSTETYHQQRAIMDDVSWKAIYMNQPVEREGLLYRSEELQRYFDLPDEKPDMVIAACDTKDRGADYCVMPIAYKYGENYYIEEILCDNSTPSIVDERLIQMLIKHKVNFCRFESNSAGGRTAKTVQDGVKERNGVTKITTKYNLSHKDTRALQASPYVLNHFYFKDESAYPSKEYRKAMNMICSYSLAGKNKHDDTVDALAQLVEYIQSFSTGAVQIIKRPF